MTKQHSDDRIEKKNLLETIRQDLKIASFGTYTKIILSGAYILALFSLFCISQVWSRLAVFSVLI